MSINTPIWIFQEAFSSTEYRLINRKARPKMGLELTHRNQIICYKFTEI